MRILQVKNSLLLFYVYMLSKYYPKRFVCVIGVCVHSRRHSCHPRHHCPPRRQDQRKREQSGGLRRPAPSFSPSRPPRHRLG